VLDVRRLRILREVARRGSLAAAADALAYTPSAVSQQVSALEREVGVPLLERRARGVVMTEAGHVLVAHAEDILARLDEAEAALADLAEVRRGRLRIASFATASATVLPLAVDRFRAKHPDVELTVAQASPREGVSGLRAGRLDLAVTVDLPEVPADGVVVTHLFDDPFRLALPRGHALADAPEVRLEDLAQETWVSVPEAMSGGEALVRACEAAGYRPRVAFESEDYRAIVELVRAGVGAALLPDLAHAPRDAVVLRSLGEDGPRRAIQAATRMPPFRSPAATAMLEILLALAPQVASAPPSR
jgi:molybdate transport repressor ModE-like protein